MGVDHALRFALWRTPGLGPASWQALAHHAGAPEQWATQAEHVLQAVLSPSQWRALAETLNRPPESVPGVEADLRWLEHPAHTVLFSDQPDYPERLAVIHQPPPLLFVKGMPHCLRVQQLAVVGTRYPTPSALQACQRITSDLVHAGLVITSGLARGVDACAHRAALAQQGASIAVLGHGLDTVYPPMHVALAEALASSGALVSEFTPDTPPRPALFPRRNRLISGLSVGVWVVEGALQSGSMITAREALEQGREVFAMPGAIHNPQTRGCHRLLRDGATLVETVDDILQGLGGFTLRSRVAPDMLSATPSHAVDPVLEGVRRGVQTPDELAVMLRLPAADISRRLVTLLVRGEVLESGGRWHPA